MSEVRIVISKKIMPRAVDRNRARRRIRAALRVLPAPARPVSLYPTRATLAMPFPVLIADIAARLKVR